MIACSKITMADALPSPYQDDDLIYENKAMSDGSHRINIPDEYSIRHRSPLPSRNQENRGTCAAHVGATISEGRLYPIDHYMSPEFIYYHRAIKPQKGMYGRDVFHILKTIGSVPDNIYPYENDDAPIPDEDIYKIANEYRIHNFARVETILGLKMALLNNEIAYLLLPSYNKNNCFWKTANKNDDPIYHAVAVVGYNKKGFIFKNSWGDQWSNDGYGIFPYKNWKQHLECWVSLN